VDAFKFVAEIGANISISRVAKLNVDTKSLALLGSKIWLIILLIFVHCVALMFCFARVDVGSPRFTSDEPLELSINVMLKMNRSRE
jgi:hypothetical protein